MHTEKIAPPRALWVPFDLGRPFGAANDADFQRDVVRAALELIPASAGPVLVDYPHDEPPTQGEQSGWTCPINYSKQVETLSGRDAAVAALNAEIEQFSPWYDRATSARGRTTVGVSGLSMSAIAELLGAMSDGPLPDSPSSDLDLADTVRLAAEDLKAYYLEATSAQPGDASHAQLNDWFWDNTVAADTLRQVKERCLASDDEGLRILGVVLLVPYNQIAVTESDNANR